MYKEGRAMTTHDHGRRPVVPRAESRGVIGADHGVFTPGIVPCAAGGQASLPEEATGVS
jgi:hypothetical protein